MCERVFVIPLHPFREVKRAHLEDAIEHEVLQRQEEGVAPVPAARVVASEISACYVSTV